jgi:hypothetical protein
MDTKTNTKVERQEGRTSQAGTDESPQRFGVCFGVHFWVGMGRFSGRHGRNRPVWEASKCHGMS